ncbi:EamA family transporter [Crassaminicella thermophila]|uniref:EamA family transporter n=1 Tax=Crassaminicella thermophila TaxID=2599308 RepID=A0A5C0SHK6_CRATE|nr:EamA family transporter [Crassaminicella thermophila]QEK12439.1 EamA family transporter [Crassaminicella thermophila]
MIISYIALILRILLMSVERIVVRLLGNDEGDSYSNIAASFLFFFIGGLFLLPFNFFIEVDNFKFIIPCYISSLVYAVGFVAYVNALAIGEVSLVTPIHSLNSLFLMLLSFIFLGESITITKVVGVIIMIAGLSILKRIGSPLKSILFILNDQSCRFMLLFVVLQSLGRILDTYFYIAASPILYSTILYFFISLNIGIFLLIKKKQNYIYHVFHNKKIISIISGAINGFAYLFLLIALNHMELSIAEPVTQVSMIITMIFSYIFFKENIKEKIPGAMLILIGGWLLLYNH